MYASNRALQTSPEFWFRVVYMCTHARVCVCVSVSVSVAVSVSVSVSLCVCVHVRVSVYAK